jgi:hypothetical protein
VVIISEGLIVFQTLPEGKNGLIRRISAVGCSINLGTFSNAMALILYSPYSSLKSNIRARCANCPEYIYLGQKIANSIKIMPTTNRKLIIKSASKKIIASAQQRIKTDPII